MLDMHFFENPRFSAASGAITLVFLALFGTMFLLTQYLQSVLGYSTVKAGAVLVPLAVVLMIFAPLSNVWVQRLGSKKVVTTGLLIVTASLLLFTTFQANSSALTVIGVTMLLALGMANVMAPATDSIMGSLPPAKAGVGSAVNDTTRQMGGAIGVAVFGSLMASHFSSAMTQKIGGTVPAPLVAQVKNNVAQAVGVATQVAPARPFSGLIIPAAKDSFVGGLHLIGVVAAGITLVAAIGVARFLPARAIEEVDHDVTTVAEPVAAGAGRR
jgi:predicted MFS family arabinose efflux permease